MSYVVVLANGACPLLRRDISGLGQPAPAAPVDPLAPPALAPDLSSVQTIMAKLTKQMRDLALEQAAINTSISIAINVIPCVGQIVGVLFSLVSTLLGNYFSNQCKTAITTFTNNMLLLGAQYQAQVTAAQYAAVQAQAPAAIQLMLSGQVKPAAAPAPATGASGLGHTWEDVLNDAIHWLANPLKMLHPVLRINYVVIKDLNDVLAKSHVPVLVNLAKELNKANSTIYSDTMRAQAAIDEAIDVSTGQEALIKTQEAIAQATAQCTSEFQSQTAIIIANINSPPYLSQLTVEIAQQLLTDPSVADLMARQSALAPGSGMTIPGATTPSKLLLALPIAGGLAAMLAIAHANR